LAAVAAAAAATAGDDVPDPETVDGDTDVAAASGTNEDLAEPVVGSAGPAVVGSAGPAPTALSTSSEVGTGDVASPPAAPSFPPPPSPPSSVFDPDAPVERSQQLHTVYHVQQLENARVQQVQMVVHADAKTLMEALLLGLPKLFQGRLPAPGSSPAGSEAAHKIARSMRMREVLHHLLLVATVSPDDSITISISPASPSPNEINGVFLLTPVAHGCTAFSMAAKVDTASADKKRDAKPSAGATTAIIQETQEAASEDAMLGRSLRTDQAADILDDVLSLVPIMFKLYDRSAEVDEAALVGFADYFARAKVEPSAGERKLLATADKFNDGKLIEVPIPVGSNRIYACKWTWMREDDDSFTAALTSVQDLDDEHEVLEIMAAIKSGKSSPKSVLGELRGCYRICPQAENVCRVTFVAQGNLGGWTEGKVPAFVLKHMVRFTLDVVKRLQER
ncbi:hypothetical protein TeGR_g4303, partial [Tetraparma gracilis]